MSKANEEQIGGDHYKKVSRSGQEHWDVSWDFNLDGFQHTISKYLFRWRQKNGLEDLKKGLHTYQKYVELVEAGKDPAEVAKELLPVIHLERTNAERCGLCGGIGDAHLEGCERALKPAWLFKDGDLSPVHPVTGLPWKGPITRRPTLRDDDYDSATGAGMPGSTAPAAGADGASATGSPAGSTAASPAG